MISRRIVFALVTVAAATAGVFSAACSSDSGGPSSGGTTTKKDPATPAPSTAPTAATAPTGIAPGSVKLAEGPCSADVDCAPSPRGTVACFVGGGGGGSGDGGSAATSYCSLKCATKGADKSTCSAPFLEFCNNRGYCKLH